MTTERVETETTDETTALVPAGQLTITVNLERGELASRAQALTALATERAQIATRDDAQRAADFLRDVRVGIKGLKAKWKEIKTPVDTALKSLREQEKADLAPLERADAIVAAPLLAWTTAEEQATRQRNAERLRQAEEQARAEQARRAEATRAAAESAPTATERRELTRMARQIEREAPLPAAVAAEAAPELAGVSTVEKWTAEVTDFAALVAAVADGRVPLDALKWDQRWLNTQANQFGRDLRYPGVRAVEKPHLATRG